MRTFSRTSRRPGSCGPRSTWATRCWRRERRRHRAGSPWTSPARCPRGSACRPSWGASARLGGRAELVCFSAARESLAALTSGRADVGFLAIEPARSADLAFTAPYVIIEGVFAVPARSPLTSVADVDAPGVRIGVKQGSAYDLYLTRTLRHAAVVRGDDGT